MDAFSFENDQKQEQQQKQQQQQNVKRQYKKKIMKIKEEPQTPVNSDDDDIQVLDVLKTPQAPKKPQQQLQQFVPMSTLNQNLLWHLTRPRFGRVTFTQCYHCRNAQFLDPKKFHVQEGGRKIYTKVHQCIDCVNKDIQFSQKYWGELKEHTSTKRARQETKVGLEEEEEEEEVDEFTTPSSSKMHKK